MKHRIVLVIEKLIASCSDVSLVNREVSWGRSIWKRINKQILSILKELV